LKANEKLQALISELISRPGHTKVTALVYKLLTDGLKADSKLIDFERQVPEVRGRIDALLGRTVFEIKSDLVRERTDAEKQLLRYLPQRELETGQRFTGIATDGADFRVYIVRDNKLVEIGSFKPDIEEPAHLLAWLESVVVLTTEIHFERKTRIGTGERCVSPSTRRNRTSLGKRRKPTRSKSKAGSLESLDSRCLWRRHRRSRPFFSTHIPHYRRESDCHGRIA